MDMLRERLGDRARFHQPMSAHTSWQVGGPAWCVCHVGTPQEVGFVIDACRRHGTPWKLLGRGSNLLVLDTGYQGVMLRLAGELASVRREEPGLWAGGGCPLATAVKLASSLGLAGLEWAAGIPGTVGGSVAGNAGALGEDMAGVLHSLWLLYPHGEVREVRASERRMDYRTGPLQPGEVVLAARMHLKPDDPQAVADRVVLALEQRRQSQPLASATAGSVFKNPPGHFAGRLIEQAGCKGLSVGEAMVSRRHANFIENQGRASARDVMGLINEVRERVRAASGVELELEVEVVGGD